MKRLLLAVSTLLTSCAYGNATLTIPVIVDGRPVMTCTTTDGIQTCVPVSTVVEGKETVVNNYIRMQAQGTTAAAVAETNVATVNAIADCAHLGDEAFSVLNAEKQSDYLQSVEICQTLAKFTLASNKSVSETRAAAGLPSDMTAVSHNAAKVDINTDNNATKRSMKRWSVGGLVFGTYIGATAIDSIVSTTAATAGSKIINTGRLNLSSADSFSSRGGINLFSGSTTGEGGNLPPGSTSSSSSSTTNSASGDGDISTSNVTFTMDSHDIQIQNLQPLSTGQLGPNPIQLSPNQNFSPDNNVTGDGTSGPIENQSSPQF